MDNEGNRYFALSSFFVAVDHQLALVKVSTAQIARFQHLRERLAEIQAEDDTVMELVLRDTTSTFWLEWDEALQSHGGSEEITAGVWETQIRNRPDEYEDPENSYVHVNVHGIHFSCTTETDEGHTGTIDWETLERIPVK